MATRKTTRPVKVKTVPSKGTVLARKYRVRANVLSDQDRQDHRAHAMSLIYGKPLAPAAHARRG